MATQLTWLGHGCWLIETEQGRAILDPFLDESPVAPRKAEQIEADYVLLSHGHFDHVADAAAIANRTGATVISNFEITQWLSHNQGVRNVEPMNLGGSICVPFGRVKMTIAHHSSQLPDGSYGGNPAGFVLQLTDGNVYFACDTSLFADMQQIGAMGLEVAVLPIGDRYTMGPDDAVEAVRLLKPAHVLPAHYNTWPPIAQDPQAWAARVQAETKAQAAVLSPGESFTLRRAQN